MVAQDSCSQSIMKPGLVNLIICVSASIGYLNFTKLKKKKKDKICMSDLLVSLWLFVFYSPIFLLLQLFQPSGLNSQRQLHFF